MGSPKTVFRIIMSVVMTSILVALLIWQDARYRLVSECQENGGQWDGANSRCRPVPKIYLDRGLKRT